MRSCLSAGLSLFSSFRSLNILAQDRQRHYSSVTDPFRASQEKLLKAFNHHLVHSKAPSWLYRTYLKLQDILPLETHQKALRSCVPWTYYLRSASARRPRRSLPRYPYQHEKRIALIFHNMIRLGSLPSREDFNFVLQQFAAVGHHLGGLRILQEMTRIDVKPSASSYGLVLQAIAHQLTLDWRVALRPKRLAEARRSFEILLQVFRANPHFLTPINYDLVLRIAKDTHDMQTFEWLLKWGYGIDLSTPDRSINPWDKPGEGILPVPDTPFPLSVAVLNTVLEKLGSTGQLSRLVQTFEVLTEPVKHVQQYFALDSFDVDDEDDDYGVLPEPTYQAPYVDPNTTTYAILLRYVSRLGNHILARHYLYQLLREDRQAFFLAKRFLNRDVVNAPSPTLGMRRDHILSVFGLANRTYNVNIITWLQQRLFPGILSHKRKMVEHTRLLIEKNSDPRPRKREKAVYNAPTFSSHETTPPGFLANIQDGENLMSQPMKKYMHLRRHLEILETDIAEIEQLQKHINIIKERKVQSQKEYLGRQVWAGKPIFLRSAGRRVTVSRKFWVENVNFRPLSEEAQWYRHGRKMMRRFKFIKWSKRTKSLMTKWRRMRGFPPPRSRDHFWRREYRRVRVRVRKVMEEQGANEKEIRAAVKQIPASIERKKVPKLQKRRSLRGQMMADKHMMNLARIGGVLPTKIS